MDSKETDTERSAQEAVRRYVRVAAFAVLGISLGALITLHYYPYLEYQVAVFKSTRQALPLPNRLVDKTATTTGAGYTLARSLPTMLSIPKLKLEVPFEAPLGLNPDKTIEAPRDFTTVGWYGYGPTPGEIGSAVILGHVDSIEGPAVFYTLGQLLPGDLVHITRTDGSVATFSVTALERYPQEEFPSDKVYGTTTDAELRLITCTGVYDHGEKRYSHNLVVYATLVAPATASSTKDRS